MYNEMYYKVILKLLVKNFKTKTKLSDTNQIVKLICLVPDNLLLCFKIFLIVLKLLYNSIA